MKVPRASAIRLHLTREDRDGPDALHRRGDLRRDVWVRRRCRLRPERPFRQGPAESGRAYGLRPDREEWRVKRVSIGFLTGRPNSDIKNLKLEHGRVSLSHHVLTRSCGAFDPPIDASGLDWGFVPRWSPKSRPHLFQAAHAITSDRCADYRDVRRAIFASTPPVRRRSHPAA